MTIQSSTYCKQYATPSRRTRGSHQAQAHYQTQAQANKMHKSFTCSNHCNLSQLQQSCSKNQHSHSLKVVIITLPQKWQREAHLQRKNQREV